MNRKTTATTATRIATPTAPSPGPPAAPAPAQHAHPDDLSWLIRCAELGSLSAAARERGCAVSQATRAIDRLEAGYGLRLLRRSTHGLSLTPEGSHAVAHGRELLARYAELSQAVGAGRHEVAGVVRVAVSAAIADEWLVPALPALLARHPALRLELVSDDRLADLVTDGIDLALRTAVGNSSAVVARPLGSFRRALYAAPDYLARCGTPLHPDELQRHVVVTHTGGGPVNRWRFRVDGRLQTIAVGHGPAANSTWLVQQMLRQGLGIGLLSMPLAAAAVARHELVEVLARYRDPARLTLHAVMLPERQRLPRIKAVVDHLLQASAVGWQAA
jgi:DNA-binding transcriptional LysR family regulator